MDAIGKIQINMVRTILHILCYKLCDCNVKEMINEDVLMYKKYCHLEHFKGSSEYVLKKILLQCPEFRNQFYVRVYKVSHKLHLARIIEIILPPEKSLYLNGRCKFGKGLFFQHGFSTIINAKSIGDYCRINQQVTIGDSTGNEDIPKIGNNVRICAGAIIVGNITIGDNVTIGAGATVYKDVPSNSVVVPNRSRVINGGGRIFDVMHMKTVSVIIPLYNKENAIKQTLMSVLSQGNIVSEIIVVDDGSTDSSASIVMDFKDPKIKYFYKQNGGVSSARNYGLEKANSDWIFFLDADDLLLSGAIEFLVNLSVKYSKATVCTANYYNVNGNERILGSSMKHEGFVSQPLKSLFEFKVVPRTGCTIYSRELLNKIGGFDERISIFEDTEFDLKVLKYAKLVYSPCPVYEHLYEFSELGSSLKPIDKFYAYYISLKKCNFYEKMMKMRIIVWTYYKFQKSNDISAKKLLKRKITNNFWWFIVYKVYSKLI